MSSRWHKALSRYLRDHAWRPAPEAVSSLHPFAAAAVLPLRGERLRRLRERLTEAARADCLLIAVVNGQAQESAHFAAANAECMAFAERHAVERLALARPGQSALRCLHLRDEEGREAWVVDARGRTPGGVGSARRIGTDCGVSLYGAAKLKSPWLRWMDADGRYPLSYFRDAGVSECVARYAPFCHFARPDNAEPLRRAAAVYDAWLRYEWAALTAVGAAGAYPAIGSLLQCHAGAYAAVRGCPERPAGEDFHLLCKLEKLGPIAFAGGQAVQLEARTVVRAPWGTAVGVRAEASASGVRRRWTHPQAFLALRELLSASAPDVLEAPTRAAWAALRPPGAWASPQNAVWFDALKQRRFLNQLSRALPELRAELAVEAASLQLGPRFEAAWRAVAPPA